MLVNGLTHQRLIIFQHIPRYSNYITCDLSVNLYIYCLSPEIHSPRTCSKRLIAHVGWGQKAITSHTFFEPTKIWTIDFIIYLFGYIWIYLDNDIHFLHPF